MFASFPLRLCTSARSRRCPVCGKTNRCFPSAIRTSEASERMVDPRSRLFYSNQGCRQLTRHHSSDRTNLLQHRLDPARALWSRADEGQDIRPRRPRRRRHAGSVFTALEQTIMDSGQLGRVFAMREESQTVMAERCKHTIEHLTGRTAVAFSPKRPSTPTSPSRCSSWTGHCRDSAPSR